MLSRSKYDSSKQALYNLPVKAVKVRIMFKILTFMYSCFVRNAPVYLIELLEKQQPKRSLRLTQSS